MRWFIRVFYRIYNILQLTRKRVTFGRGITFNGILFVSNFGEITLGSNLKLTSGKRYNPIGGDTVLRIICRKGGKINIGDNVGISNCTFFISNSLLIEDNVLFGGGCRVWDSDFHSIDANIRIYGGDTEVHTAPIYIKENAFIGGGSILLKGITIGENAIIGAGSVVTKSVPDNEIWAGNPAKKIKDLK